MARERTSTATEPRIFLTMEAESSINTPAEKEQWEALLTVKSAIVDGGQRASS